jgi:hypothetical protein
MSEGPKTILKLIGIALIFGVAGVVAYGTPAWQFLLLPIILSAYAVNAWAISELLLAKWRQPERTFGMLGFAALLTYAETFPPFYVASSFWGV